MYLLHTLAIRAVDKVVDRIPLEGEVAGAVTFACVLAGSLVVADVLHRFFEQPLVERGRRIAGRLAGTPTSGSGRPAELT